MDKEKGKIVNAAVRRFGLPKDCVYGDCMVYLVGNREMVIQNYRNVCFFEESCIVISLKHNKMEIHGKKLVISYYLDDELRIEGRIDQILFAP